MCNLGSINLAQPRGAAALGFRQAGAHRRSRRAPAGPRHRPEFLSHCARHASSNMRWRPVGLGVMGLQDVFFQLRLPFDSEAARALSRRISRSSVFPRPAHLHASWRASTAPHPRLCRRPAPRGRTAVRLPGEWRRRTTDRWDATCSAKSAAHGLRNSLLIAIAPTATIASIAGCYECIEPQMSNLFKRETLSGRLPADQRYLIEELKQLGTVDAGDSRRHQARGRFHAGAGGAARRSCATSTAPPGNCR